MGLYNLDGEQFAKSIPMVLSSYGIFATYFTRIPGSALEKGGRMSKSSFDAGGIKLASTSSKGIVFGQTTPYTCASCALQMRLDDLGVVLPEAKIASALNTTTNGTKILDIPSAINKMGLE